MQHSAFRLARCAAAAALLLSAATASATEVHHHHRYHHHHARYFGPYATGPAYQSNLSGTHNNGYVYNGIGYGRFVQGPDGSFGGYPAGSAGAEELMNQQRYKCEAVPEEC